MKSFKDVIQQLIQVNQQLIDGSISVEVAKQIATNTQVIINAAKVGIQAQEVFGIKFDFFEDIKLIQDIPNNKKAISARYIKGLFDISEQESESFYKFCLSKHVYTLGEFGDGMELFAKYNEK